MDKASWIFLFVAVLFQMLAMALSSSCSAYPSDPSSASGSLGLDGELKPVRREEYDGGRILDISHFYREDMPYFGLDEGMGQFLCLPKSMKNGSLANTSEMKLPAHTGTHVDAPGHVFQHYFEAGFDVDTLDLAVLNGPALLVDVSRDKNITAEVMKSLNIPKGIRRVLFRTLNTDRQLMWKRKFDTSFVGFTKDGARWLVDNTHIKLVGIDYLSVAAFDDLIPSHLVFLESRGQGPCYAAIQVLKWVICRQQLQHLISSLVQAIRFSYSVQQQTAQHKLLETSRFSCLDLTVSFLFRSHAMYFLILVWI